MALDDHLKGNEISHKARVDPIKLKGFRAEHEAHTKNRNYSVAYCPTSVGTVVTISCPCGKTKDITDYESF